MAFTCNYTTQRNQVNYPNAHLVIGGYQELNKETIAVSVMVFRDKQDYLNKIQPVDYLRLVSSVGALASSINFRTGIYTWLMKQPQFTNPVADISNDF